MPETSQRARSAIRSLLELFQDDRIEMTSLYGDSRNADDQILSLISNACYPENGTTVVTNDLGLQVRLIQHKFDFQSHAIEIPSIVCDEINLEALGALYKAGNIPNFTEYGPGQCLLLSGALCMVTRDGELIYRIRAHEPWGIKPKGMAQQFLAELLMCPDYRLATATGPAGCGKTLYGFAG